MDLRPAGDVAPSLVADVTSPTAVAAAAAQVEDELGPVDALVTAAGIDEQACVEDIDDARWERMMAADLGGT